MSNLCPYWRRGYCVADKACKLEHDPSNGGQHQETLLAQQRFQKAPPQPPTYSVSAVSMASALYGGGQPMAYGYGYYAPNPAAAIVGVIGQPGGVGAMAPKNYKTVSCRHFLRGHCMRGTACGFRHTDEEPSSGAPPSGFGQLPAELANPLHPGRPFRVVTCRRWAQGNCSLGDRCTFKHDFDNDQHYSGGVKRQLSGGNENAEPTTAHETKVLKIASE